MKTYIITTLCMITGSYLFAQSNIKQGLKLESHFIKYEDANHTIEKLASFKTCKDAINPVECSSEKFHAFVNAELVYPITARENYIEGKCNVRIVIDRNGNIASVNVYGDDSNLFTEAIKDVVASINKKYQWEPAYANGEATEQTIWFKINFSI